LCKKSNLTKIAHQGLSNDNRCSAESNNEQALVSSLPLSDALLPTHRLDTVVDKSRQKHRTDILGLKHWLSGVEHSFVINTENGFFED